MSVYPKMDGRTTKSEALEFSDRFLTFQELIQSMFADPEGVPDLLGF
jgi:hypothetical protein